MSHVFQPSLLQERDQLAAKLKIAEKDGEELQKLTALQLQECEASNN